MAIGWSAINAPNALTRLGAGLESAANTLFASGLAALGAMASDMSWRNETPRQVFRDAALHPPRPAIMAPIPAQTAGRGCGHWQASHGSRSLPRLAAVLSPVCHATRLRQVSAAQRRLDHLKCVGDGVYSSHCRWYEMNLEFR